jgi:polyisoprenoid-binding protein YceI
MLELRYPPNPEGAMHLFLAALISLSSSAFADRFAGDNSSGHVKFDLDSTLHNVPGNAASFTSEITIEDGVSGVLTIQSTSIKTGIKVRDQRMYDFCLDAQSFPTITFELRGITGDEEGFKSKTGTGTVNLHGKLNIRSTSRDLIVPTSYTWTETGVKLNGKSEVKWSDYGVPDPSILISTVQPVLTMNFELDLQKTF